eukprot:m.358163 g.358163  ORF g.358163 m.358163 type:complete len:505 (-) comp18065_c0_seq1:145-1659(-)
MHTLLTHHFRLTTLVLDFVHFDSVSTLSPIMYANGGLNPNVEAAQYAVRGEIYNRAQQRKAQGKEVIFTNIGNPQSIGQKPLTFPRQVLALTTCPSLMENPAVVDSMPADAVSRAKEYLENFPGGTGAYQDSRGNLFVRKQVAAFIEQRDGIPANPEHIFLTDGASPAIQRTLNLIIRDKNDGILLPIPQYPLYSASVTAFGGQILGYELDEDNNWSLGIDVLDRAVASAKDRGVQPRALVVINPGNPTGNVLSEENIRELLQWARVNGIVVLADEVYQENIYGDRPFVSFKRVLHDMGPEQGGNSIQLFSYHTVSKGVYGECGRRGGYMEFVNIPADVGAELYKLASINLSSNVDGQIMVGLMVQPPVKGDASYESHKAEMDSQLQSLKRRADKVSRAFAALQGVACQRVEGAMYAFPRISIPEAAVAEAKQQGVAPDLHYCLQMLEETGICAVPGSGFGQAEGTFHFRTTILPPEDQVDRVIQLFEKFHLGYLKRYGGASSL